MKTINNIKFLSILFFIGLVLTSCVKDDDFSTPDVTAEEPNIDVNFSISLAKEAYGGFEPVLIEGEALYLEGYVVSSDEAGSFYKTLVIQDSPENPTAGIAISTEDTDLYTFYEPGRKIYFRVDGLYSGEFAGLPTLGVLNAGEVGRISLLEFRERIVRSSEFQEIVPQIRTINQLSDGDLNTLIMLENVQVSDEDLGQSYANLDNTFSVNRTIINCERTADIILRNSGFASFKNELMPEGSGSLTAVFSVFNNDYQLFIRDTNDVNFDQDRCVPTGVSCGLASATGSNQLFADNFETQTINTPISGNGWTNFVEAGSEAWEAFEDNGANQSLGVSARCGSYQSGDASTISWLITPEISLATANQATIEFKTSNSFADSSNMQVLFSSDWDGTPGNITSATWELLIDATIVQNSDAYQDWIFSGNVDLSCVESNGYFAFKYIGSGDSGADGTYELDEILISSF